MSRLFSTVDEHVARNPIARAVARQAARVAVRDLTIGWYIPTPTVGHEEHEATAKALLVALAVVEMQGKRDQPAATFMCLAVDALQRIAERGYTVAKDDAPCIDVGLQYALDTLLTCTPQQNQDAWLRVHNLERVG